jgi:hypothetical protein
MAEFSLGLSRSKTQIRLCRSVFSSAGYVAHNPAYWKLIETVWRRCS